MYEYSHMDAHMAQHSRPRASSARPAAAKQSNLLSPEPSTGAINGNQTFSEALATLQVDISSVRL